MGIEALMVTIKGAMAFKDLAAGLISSLARPLFWLTKFIFYRPFVSIYYLVFRVKKYELGQESKKEIIKKKSFHIAALILIFCAIALNLGDKKQASAAIGKQKQSVMAELVKNDFSDIGQNNDELIEENAAIISADSAASKYLNKQLAMGAKKGVAPENISEDSPQRSLTDNAIAKPRQIIAASGQDAGPSQSSEPASRDSVIEYAVQSGDTISTIARRFRINVNTVLWANNLSAFSVIRIGDKLKILPTDGFIYTVKRGDTIGKLAQNYDTTAEKIIASNNLGNNGNIVIGQDIIIPGTKRSQSSSGSIAKTPSPNSYSGLDVIKDIVKSEKPIISGNKMVWPTVGHRITQYFSWKHNGLDIANKIGTPLYAADAGVVEISQGGYNGGYGNTILINHGGGKKTRYGHASKLLVKKGEQVEKGQLIALMGSTGRSTGSHLHFEVIINGVRYNPLNYIK